MDIWVPFSINVAEDGTAIIANKAVDHLIREFSLHRENGSLDVKLRISKDNCSVSVVDRWADVWPLREFRDPNGEDFPVLRFRKVRYIYVYEDNYIVALDQSSEVAVPDGLTVVMNVLQDDKV